MPPPPIPERADREELPPVVVSAPPAGKKFPCKKCGAGLEFKPGSRALNCPYCGFTEKIAHGPGVVQERPLEGYLSRLAAQAATLAGRSSEVSCTSCGAVVLVEDQVATDDCPYCGVHFENQPHAAEDMLSPECIVPFALDSRAALDAFDRWLRGRWFAPNTLKRFANLGKLTGVYVPFWTYDAMTYTWYTGERGVNYQETETYKDSQGQKQTRTVTKTRWTWVTGEIQHFFDDVLICASRGVPEHLAPVLPPDELRKVEPFQAEFLTGFKTERYTIDPQEGFTKAQAIMDGDIRSRCLRAIGGDQQRLHTVETQYLGVTIKYVLLPAWLASYRYFDRSYQVVINARTGEVRGERPYSWVKIVSLILLLVAVIGLLIFLFTR
jgi:predicted RNA-binding Zn-ribbon protein involved in translation (DUF1610 family)